MNPWIQNTSLSNVKKGHHSDPGPNSMLIQICDPPGDFPEPKFKFKEVHQFDFFDAEKYDNIEEDAKCSQDQADELARLLKHAFVNNMNVIVHCHAGICRSGAVCEVGVMMGFKDTDVFRSPNLLVKHQMMKALGWTYDESEPHSVNGKPLKEDWTSDMEKISILIEERRKYRELKEK